MKHVIKQINLYQAEFRPPRVLLPARSLALSGVVFLLGLLALFGWENLKLKQLQAQVSQVEQRANAVTQQIETSVVGAPGRDAALIREAQSLEERVRVLKRAQDAVASGELGSETGYSAYFLALSRTVRTKGAWLTGVTVAESGRALSLQGRALSGADAARLVADLRRDPVFVGLSFSGLTVAPPETNPKRGDEPAEQAAETPRFLIFTLDARQTEQDSAAASKVVGRQP
jgi:Tfp pilus assembly protein PilN